MTYTFDQSKDEIARLVKHFETNRVAFLASAYKEAQARQEFIDPLFIALNWDVHNQQQTAPDYREVVVEDSLEMPGHEARKAPDYVFRVGRDRKFFAEAKKPGVDLKMAAGPAYQLRRYAWSAKLPLSVLTDFQEWAAYDCRIRPSEGDKTSTARLAYMTYEEYADRWREVWDVFSREAVWGGSFDQFAQGSKGKRGTSEVDAEFLKEIEGWRNLLAHNIAIRNPDLTLDEMNDAVQRTIDRIIFLRMVEARGMEEYGQLQRIAEGEDIYTRLLALSKKADTKYNSGLFDFSKSGDQVTPRLTVDDKTLKPILADLYYPQSPYEFSVLPAEILGNVYEQFLGKVIRLTASHQAKVEEKPEVKKAGGVYYTPSYIVEYIVKNTVGKQIEGKSPAQLNSFRVLDPACGSGSFLLGAYTLLLEYYHDWYSAHEPGKHKEAVAQQPDGSWQLTLPERKRILTEHIFGVDIDRQAVEVTKLSLLLKVLEGMKQLTLFAERALPNLDANIKCGNSLIGTDYFTSKMMPDTDELKRLNPFDWKQGFPEAMQAGGFDCVIGNPPYVRQEILGDTFKSYAQKTFTTYAGTADLYVYFIEQSHNLLRPGGLFGFIVANKWMRANYGGPLRHWLKARCLEEIIDFGDLPVFQSATTYPCIMRISKNTPHPSFAVTQVKSLKFISLEDYVASHRYPVKQSTLGEEGWSLVDETQRALLVKLRVTTIPLSDYAKGHIYRGVLTGFNEAFVINAKTRSQLISENTHSTDLIRPFLAGRDIKRYQPPPTGRFIIFTRRGIDIKKYPAIYKYLSQFKEQLMPKPKNWKGDRWEGRKSGNYQWYEIQDTVEYYTEFERPKIIVPAIVQSASYILDRSGFYSNDKTSIIAVDDLYLLGLLNSKVPDFIMHSIASTKQGGYFEYKPMYIGQLPINFSDSTDKARHDNMIMLVEQMLDLHKRKVEAKDSGEQERLQRVINSTDQQIDKLVYELYELTPEEVAIVEETTVKHQGT
jgi:hypothetical protein